MEYLYFVRVQGHEMSREVAVGAHVAAERALLAVVLLLLSIGIKESTSLKSQALHSRHRVKKRNPYHVDLLVGA